MVTHKHRGLAMFLVGILFATVTNRGDRSSMLGLIVGLAIMALGLFQMYKRPRTPPPA